MKKSELIENPATGEAWYIVYNKDGIKRKYNLITDTNVWRPKKPSDICPEYMLRFCKAKGIEDLRWYVGILNSNIKKGKEGKDGEIKVIVERKRTPTEVRSEFVDRYFQDLKKKPAPLTHSAKAKQELAEMEALQVKTSITQQKETAATSKNK